MSHPSLIPSFFSRLTLPASLSVMSLLFLSLIAPRCACRLHSLHPFSFSPQSAVFVGETALTLSYTCRVSSICPNVSFISTESAKHTIVHSRSDFAWSSPLLLLHLHLLHREQMQATSPLCVSFDSREIPRTRGHDNILHRVCLTRHS